MSITIRRDIDVSIRLADERGDCFAIGIGADGPSSTSGQLLAVRGNGERVEIDALRLVDAIWAEALRWAAEKRGGQ